MLPWRTNIGPHGNQPNVCHTYLPGRCLALSYQFTLLVRITHPGWLFSGMIYPATAQLHSLSRNAFAGERRPVQTDPATFPVAKGPSMSYLSWCHSTLHLSGTAIYLSVLWKKLFTFFKWRPLLDGYPWKPFGKFSRYHEIQIQHFHGSCWCLITVTVPFISPLQCREFSSHVTVYGVGQAAGDVITRASSRQQLSEPPMAMWKVMVLTCWDRSAIMLVRSGDLGVG